MPTKKQGLNIKELCRPAFIYFVISIVAFAIILIQNIGQPIGKYCMGSFSCDTPSVIAIFILEFIYILFFTWVLDLICKAGYSGISWFLVLLPFILFFLLITLYMLMQNEINSKANNKHTTELLTQKAGMEGFESRTVSFSFPPKMPWCNKGNQMGGYSSAYGGDFFC